MKPPLGNRLRLALFGALAVALVAVPLWLILAQEQALSRGEVFRFRTAPVDPYDAFRGRYVALGFPPATATVPAGMKVDRGQKVYVSVERDEQGFARLGTVAAGRPSAASYLRLAAAASGVGGEVRLVLPFDRFYMNEFQAPEAERVYRRSVGSRSAGEGAWVEVRVYKGRAVIEELFVEGRPVREVLRQP